MSESLNEALRLHGEWQGKYEIKPVMDVMEEGMLAKAYTPGVAEPCKEIHKDKSLVYKYTRKWNTVAVVTDGTAVLGLGDIGPEAGLPVMEGKAVLFKAFADVDAIPICLDTKDPDEIVKVVKALEPTFGGINLEDISAPRCFEIEKRLKEVMDIPVFHDDQHGTAIVTLAAILNGLKVVGKNLADAKIVVSGDGAAGTAITKLLLGCGAKDVVVCGLYGALVDGEENRDAAKIELAALTNPNHVHGTIGEVIKDRDVFIGVSAPGIVTKEMVASMAEGAMVLSMANPVPEIMPQEAKAAGARVVGSGRSDFPNQVNNVLAFPGIFRGALDVRAKGISEGMKLAAARALAELVENPTEGKILPDATDPRVGPAVAKAVSEAARKEGIARI